MEEYWSRQEHDVLLEHIHVDQESFQAYSLGIGASVLFDDVNGYQVSAKTCQRCVQADGRKAWMLSPVGSAEQRCVPIELIRIP